MPLEKRTRGSRSRGPKQLCLVESIRESFKQQAYAEFDANYDPASPELMREKRMHLEATYGSRSPETSRSASGAKSAANISSQPVEAGRRKFRKSEKDQSSRT